VTHRLEDDLKALRVPAPPGITDAVMRQIAARRAPRPSLWQRLWRPRTLTLRPAPLFAIGLLLAALALLLRPHPRAPLVVPAPREAVREVAAPVLVRFTLAAPDAHAVSVAGDFNGWRPDAAPCERGPDGVWRVTLPLGAGRWSYSFVVDGKWVEDPLAEAWRDDGFGGRNAVVRVGG
jgi:hypothetical protein